MKKILISLALIATVAVSCGREEIPAGKPSEVFTYTFILEDGETRATLDNEGVFWESGDRVGMFLEGYTGYANINAGNQPKTVTLYSRSEIPAGSYAYAYYPYNAGNNDKSAVTVTIPNVQDGGSASAMPMAGIPFAVQEAVPLSGTSAQTNGVIQFFNLGAIIDFRIFSSEESLTSETVQYITFKSEGVPLAGDATINLAALSESLDEEHLALTWGSSFHDQVKVNQTAPVASSQEDATPIYMVLAPGSYISGTIVIATDAATYTFPFSNKSLGRNKLKHYNMDLSDVDREAGVTENIVSLPYSEAFTATKGEFEIDGGTGYEWQFRSTYGATANGYYKDPGASSNTRHDVVTSLISPWIDLRLVDGATLSFEHAANSYFYGGSVPDGKVYIKRYSDTGWTLLEVPFPTKPSSGYSAYLPVEKDLSAYAGELVKIRFEYTSTTTRAGTWEIRNFSCVESVPPTPVVRLGWLELPAYAPSDMSGTSTSSLTDLYLVKHFASMNSRRQRNYSCLYDPEMYASYWVAYPLCTDHMGSGRTESWGYDPEVPESKQTEVFPSSYGYGANHPTENFPDNFYARGHQIPNADRNGVDEMMAQTYYMTNITPQIQDGFNANIWLDLEIAVRDVARACDTVYVVTGAAFRKKGGSETINYMTNTRYDQKELPVPNYYWKALLKVTWSGNEVTAASSIGFWLPHDDLYGDSYDDDKYVVSVSQIEQWTGVNLFANLPASLQSAAEGNTNWNSFRSF